MKSTFVMAQLQALPDPKDNLEKAEQAIKDAKAQYNPDFMVFPERFMFQYPEGTDRKTILSASQPINGPFVTAMRKLAKEYGVWMVFGMNETVHDDNDDRNYNTSVMVDNNGEIKGTYRKTHLYDAFGHQESADTKPGNELFNPVMTPFGKIGMFLCYEIRFPEVARDQTAKGADIIIMPAAWAKGDLKSLHFKTLITSRAVENTVYVLACDQCGPSYLGESIAIDPMGVSVGGGSEEEELIPVRIDTDRIKSVRKKLPSFKNRRPDVYLVK